MRARRGSPSAANQKRRRGFSSSYGMQPLRARALENALDAASRPTRRAGGTANRVGGDQCLTEARALGGLGMNHHLRRSLVFLIVRAMPELEAYFGAAANIFDAQGNLPTKARATSRSHSPR